MAITTSVADDKEFGAHFLSDILAWIEDYFVPLDIFSEDALKVYMRDAYDPEDIFEWDTLAAWAEHNGFVYAD